MCDQTNNGPNMHDIHVYIYMSVCIYTYSIYAYWNLIPCWEMYTVGA